MLPTLYLSHGSPTLPFDDVAARDFLRGLGGELPRPDAIVMVSAHWDSPVAQVNSVTVNPTIHDFYGFPQALYEVQYPAPGSPELAAQVAELIGDAGLQVGMDSVRGLDHGAWVPLMLMYPDADIPVVQVSIQSHLGPGHHVQLGRALAVLRERNVLIIASGSMTHNLRALNRMDMNAPEPAWVRDFAEWMHDALINGRSCDLVSYRALAPYAEHNHPHDDHLLPLFVAYGAAGAGAGHPAPAATRLHTSTTLGALRMDAYAFS
ncbi:dioxygenase [Novosphingobium sp. FSY-8]|uniref:Dioxygenase n=1 Tax=Novosphingobium ovatum TaxID=1908523 RepID=A0ABW9XHX7_9SPHN|nr:class III extradiol ring-cleavage dioxygenase [Novosphingobium ovatum]NBC38150.1 dioxygenase [Novosphingobium ovatum]